MTIWQYLPQRLLQEQLEKMYPGLLPRLEIIIPAVSSAVPDPTLIYQRKQFIKVLNAFLDAGRCRNPSFLKSVLDHVPTEVLEEFGGRIGCDGKGKEFQAQRDAVISKVRTSRSCFREFLTYFELPKHLDEAPPQKIQGSHDYEVPSPDNPQTITASYKPLKDYQCGVYFEAIRRYGVARNRFIVQMPTGSGKTRTAMELIAEVLNREEDGALVVWLAHSEELCSQAFDCFDETWRHLGRKRITAYRSWGEHDLPKVDDGRSAFIVAGFQKLSRRLGSNPKSFEHFAARSCLIVVDEAHKTLAPTFQAVTDALTGDNTCLVGLTATPGRANDEESQRLANYYFGMQVGIATAPDESVIGMLQRRKVLAKVEYQELKSNLSFSLTDAERKSLEREFDFPPGFLKRVGQADLRNVEILKRLLRECGKGSQILFFACDIEHSKFITAMLLYFEQRAGHVDGTTNQSTRQELIRKFKDGEIQVLCNVGVLSTGFDAPKTDVVFISRPTGSLVLYSQMIGRGLRGPAIGGTPRCLTIDVRDNIDGYGDADSAYRYFDEYFK